MAAKDVVRTERAPAPFQGAPYNQAIVVGDLVFVAGQLGLAPGATEMVGPGITEQTEQVMQNLTAILDEAGSGLANLVKTTVFLASMADYPKMNEVYERFLGKQPPARSTVEAGALPKGAKVEIDLIAAF